MSCRNSALEHPTAVSAAYFHVAILLTSRTYIRMSNAAVNKDQSSYMLSSIDEGSQTFFNLIKESATCPGTSGCRLRLHTLLKTVTEQLAHTGGPKICR